MSSPTLASRTKRAASTPCPVAENVLSSPCPVAENVLSSHSPVPLVDTSAAPQVPPSLRFLGMPSRSLHMLQQASDPTRKNSRLNAQVAAADPDWSVSRSLSESSMPVLQNGKLSSARPLHHVRKKSGELVKLSLKDDNGSKNHTRSKSLPSTPTDKQVRFGFENAVCYFKKKDKPLAISATNSPTSSAFGVDADEDSDTDLSEVGEMSLGLRATIWELTLVDFPRLGMETRLASHPMVILEDIYVCDQKTVVAHIAAKNIAFEKAIYVRYSLDGWATIIEKPAFYTSQRPPLLSANGYDRFTFQVSVEKMFEGLCLSSKAESTPNLGLSLQEFQLCVKFSANNHDYWDNNGAVNYHFVIERSSPHKTEASSAPLDLHCVKPKYTSRQRRRSSTPDDHTHPPPKPRAPQPLPEHNDFVLNDFYMSSPLFTSLHSKADSGDLEFRKTSTLDNGSRDNDPLRVPPAPFPSGPLHVNYKDTFNSQSYQEFLNRFCFFSPSSSRGAGDELGESKHACSPNPHTRAAFPVQNALTENDHAQLADVAEPHRGVSS